MAASVGFFNPHISNTANVLVAGSILAGACVLQQVAKKTFEEKAHQENEISSKHYSMIALAGSCGLAGLLAGADIRKSASLAVASLVLLAVVEYVSLHFNPESKTPGSPEGKRPDSATPSPKPPQEGRTVKGKSPKKTPGTISSIPTSGTPPKGSGRGSTPPPQAAEKAAPASSARNKWPDSLVKTAPPKVSPSKIPPKPVVQSPPVPPEEEKSPGLAPKGSGRESPTSPPLTAKSSSPTITKQDSPQFSQKESDQDSSEEEVGPPPPPAFDVSKLDPDLVERAQRSAQSSVIGTTLPESIIEQSEKDNLMANLGNIWNIALDNNLAEEEGFEVTAHEDSVVGDAEVAVAAASLTPKKSKLEYMTAEIISTEQTFFVDMTSYLGELNQLKDGGFISEGDYAFLIKGITEIQETSPLFIDQVEKMGAFAAYSNTVIMDKYFSALIIMTEHADAAREILQQTVNAMEAKQTQEKFKNLWKKAILPVQRAARHPLFLKDLGKKVDPSFKPLRQKFADWVDKFNNRKVLEQFNSLIPVIKAISQSNATKFEIKDAFGVITYRVTEREKTSLFQGRSKKSDPDTVKASSKANGLRSLLSRSSSKPESVTDSAEQKTTVFQKTTTPPKPGEITDSVAVLEHTLDFLIRLAQNATDGKTHPGLETITTKEISDCFTTLVKHEWYQKNEAGEKKLHLKTVPNGIAGKAKELRTILGLEEKAN